MVIKAINAELWGVFDATATPEPPNLYELTRQTAENTRWIFWVLVAGVIELGCLSSFLMFKKR